MVKRGNPCFLYLNTIVCVTFSFQQGGECWGFIGAIVQFAYVGVLLFGSNIHGHTVWLEVTLHSAAALVGHSLSSYHVTLEYFV